MPSYAAGGEPSSKLISRSPPSHYVWDNCTVVSKDGDLPAVPGLSVENWATS